MVGLGTTEIVVIAALILAMGLFWGVLAFFVGWSFFTRGKRTTAPPPQAASGDGDRPDDGADDAR